MLKGVNFELVYDLKDFIFFRKCLSCYLPKVDLLSLKLFN